MSSVTQHRRKVTYTDLLQLPEDGPRYELYDGEVWEMPAPTLKHQLVTLQAVKLFDDYATRVGGLAVMSPIDVIFSEYDVLQPDVVMFSPARRSLLRGDDRIRVPPDLVVEVLSPSTARNDRIRKLEMFARYGVPEYWMVDPVECRIDVLALEAGHFVLAESAGRGETVTSRLFPDLTAALDSLCVEP